jgi:hypothetical protein
MNSSTVASNLIFNPKSVLVFYQQLPVWPRPVKRNDMELDRDLAVVFLLVLHAQSTVQEPGCKRPLKIKCTVLSGCISQTICRIATVPAPFEVLHVAVTVGSSCMDVPWREKRNGFRKRGGSVHGNCGGVTIGLRLTVRDLNRTVWKCLPVRRCPVSGSTRLCLKVPRLRPLVVLIREMLSLRRMCIIGGMFLTRGNGSTGRKPCPGATPVRHKSDIHWAGIEPCPPQWEAGGP